LQVLALDTEINGTFDAASTAGDDVRVGEFEGFADGFFIFVEKIFVTKSWELLYGWIGCGRGRVGEREVHRDRWCHKIKWRNEE